MFHIVDNRLPKYKIFNPENEQCPACAIMNRIYTANDLHIQAAIPADMGKGYYQKTVVKPSMELYITDLTFANGMKMAGGADIPLYYLAFCLGEPFQWRVEGKRQEYTIESGESYIFNGISGVSICDYLPGQRFLGLSLQLGPSLIDELTRHLVTSRTRLTFPDQSGAIYKLVYTPTVRRILQDIIYCRYRDELKRMYLEGKVLELLAVYMHEVMMGSDREGMNVKLSRTDRQCLRQAKEILDQSLTHPPTIGELARLVCLNEYKLKTASRRCLACLFIRM